MYQLLYLVLPLLYILLYGTRLHCSGDKIEENEMGGACSAYVREEKCIQGFGGET